MTKSNTPIDQSNIPRPLNCFLMYRLEKQKEIVAKCSGANHRDISKIIAKWWQEASEEEKKPFRERARIAKMEHRKLYPDYKYTPKKKVTPKRVYIRKNKKEQFTSRAKENNKIMELIYEDPHALESINGANKSAKSSSAVTAPKNKVIKKTRVSKKRAANTVVMENVYADFKEEEVYYDDFEKYHSSCEYANSVSSTQTVPDFYFDSPQASSPYTDYESNMPSPYFESLSFDFNVSCTSPPVVEQSLSPYSVLDTPYINEYNAYEPTPLNEQIDYFHFDHNTNNDINNKYTQEFSWTECPDYYFTEQCQSSIMVQMTQPVQYIDPALLHM